MTYIAPAGYPGSVRTKKLRLVVVGSVTLAVTAIGVLTVFGFTQDDITHNDKGTQPSSKTQPAAASTSYAIPACYNPAAPPVERPKKLNVVGCMSVAVALQDMSWSSWGPDGADGSGTAVFAICDPNCAAGYQVTDPVLVHAWNPQQPRAGAVCQAGLRIFADMIVAFPKGLPPPTAQKTITRYHGIPAAHYVNYTVDKAPDEQFIGYTFCS